jgi:Flp pilus assembly protein CpaB
VQFAQRLLSTRGGTIGVSVMAAVLAAVILIAYLHRYRESVQDGSVPVTILVAKGLIEKGTSGDIIASQDLYQVSTLPKGEVADGALTDPATLKGRVTTADIFPGEQLTSVKVESGGATSLANRITGDQRAVTVPIDAAHGMVGQINAGDHVDVYAGFNVKKLNADGTPNTAAAERPVLKLIVPDVLVLDAPEDGSAGLGAGGSKAKLTLRMDDQQAASAAFAADNGVLWVLLRPKVNADPSSPNIVTLETVLFGVPSVAVVRSLGGKP